MIRLNLNNNFGTFFVCLYWLKLIFHSTNFFRRWKGKNLKSSTRYYANSAFLISFRHFIGFFASSTVNPFFGRSSSLCLSFLLFYPSSFFFSIIFVPFHYASTLWDNFFCYFTFQEILCPFVIACRLILFYRSCSGSLVRWFIL